MIKHMTRKGSTSIAVALVCVLVQSAAFAAPKPGSTIPTCTTSGQTNCTDFYGFPNYAYSTLPAATVTAITVTAAGKGYTSVPAVTITDSRGAGSGATATATVVGGAVTSITVNSPGSGYVAPEVTIAAPPAVPATNQTAAATATLGGTITGGMRKFVDTLPGLTSISRPAGTAIGPNNLGQYIPLATPDTTTFTGSDYYVIGLTDHNERMHSDLPVGGTKLRGYYQVNGPDTSKHYLGPLILATKNRPVRVMFENQLPLGTAGDLFIPSDTTYMGAGQGPDGTWYTQNRATLHLHGGNTPWISDGTPHQWITPAGEAGTLLKGDSFQNVPDMVGPGKPIPTPANNDGKGTFYWTNQQGGRLMFYHDHAYGATRTNVYAGEAAGYLLVDPAEELGLFNASAPGTIRTPGIPLDATNDLAHLIPLVIQDKTFVPPPAQLAKEDPTWTNWNNTLNVSIGTLGEGSLWFPHVYMTNQDPNDPLNLNAFGRWDYGPWFVPPQNSLSAANPPTAVTIPCSSQAYPGLTNLKCPIIPNPSGTPESFMDTPVINGTAYPVLHVAPAAYRFQILSAGNDRAFALSWFVADATGKEVPMMPAVTPAANVMPVCTSTTSVTNQSLQIGLATGDTDATGPINGTGLPSNCWPSTWPTTTGITSAGLTGVVPNPLFAGPAWIQIGTEGGLLPAPVVIPPTPTLFETNPKSVTVGSVATHGLFLGPAERADVIVDFSRFAGKTLILYNDSPAPVPGYDIRNDHFTGNADQAPAGGTPPTLPGYGPNTRTIMQVVVDATNANSTAFNLTTLVNAFKTPTGIFATTQPAIIVPENTYNDTYTASFTNTYMKIQDNSLTFTKVGSTTPITVNLKPKAIQELFTLDYGRLNATLGAELPLSNFLTQTTIPLAYIDPPNEILANNQIQLWRVTHNGVDTHLIHFHLVNVQVINRVGWDGTIRPADANELGWKDTVKMNPLEDIVVAMKPLNQQQLPFVIPDSIRKLDVTQPVGSTMGFTGVDPLTNLPITVTNQLYNFGNEYVWHCHILGHEENDMMRPIVFKSNDRIGVFTNGTWYVDSNGNGAWNAGTDTSSSFGTTGDIPVYGDWDGSGTTRRGVFNNGTWTLDMNGLGTANVVYSFGGLPGAVPVTGDWSGNGTTKIGVFVNGRWYLDMSGNGAWDGTPTDTLYSFGGLPGAVPVTGDWNGSGTTKIGVFLPADGRWYLDYNGNGAWNGTPSDVLYSFGGLPGAKPVIGKW